MLAAQKGSAFVEALIESCLTLRSLCLGSQHSINAREERSTMEDWAQRWLELSIMPCFAPHAEEDSGKEGTAEGPAVAAAGQPGAGGQQLSVRAYLSSPQVVVFNQVLRHANEQNLRHVTENLQNMSHDALHQLLSLWKSSASTLAYAQQSLMQQRAPPKEPKEQLQPGGEGLSAAMPPRPAPQLEPMASAAAVVTSVDSGGAISEASLYQPATMTMPEEYTSDGMAAAAPPSAAVTGPATESPSLATTAAPSAEQTSPSSWAVDAGSASSGPAASSAAAASPLSVLSGIQSGAIRPRVTARIVDPTANKLLQTPQASSSSGGGSGPMRFALIAARVTAVAAVAGIAWASGRYAMGGSKEVSVATVMSQLRGLAKVASSSWHRTPACSTTVVLASSRAAIEQVRF